jgi:mannose-1-phosphate guanylyltransferase
MRVAEDPRLWSVILAGGEGQRMRALIQRWLGSHKPKQYCTFVGNRSMFQHTLDRTDMLTPPARTISVVARSHRAEVSRQIGHRQAGRIVFQPANRDTAAGIFLALTHVRHHDPEAIVAVFPSDHFIFPDHCFIQSVCSVVKALDTWRDRIILLGAAPDRPDSDYGWIQPGRELGWSNGCSVRTVRSFVEKPPPALALKAMEGGALWNTLVFAARVETLWSLGWQCLPQLMGLFKRMRVAIGNRREEDFIEKLYRLMPACNFSSQLLARVTHQAAVMELRDVIWSDWGRPERITAVLESLGKRPAFGRQDAYAS